jgi:hypothetical protein
MRQQPMKFIGPALALGIIAICGTFAGKGYAAAGKTQPPAHIFTPACAAPPKCPVHFCARNGRCNRGNHTQASGCLYYTCRPSPR